MSEQHSLPENGVDFQSKTSDLVSSPAQSSAQPGDTTELQQNPEVIIPQSVSDKSANNGESQPSATNSTEQQSPESSQIQSISGAKQDNEDIKKVSTPLQAQAPPQRRRIFDDQPPIHTSTEQISNISFLAGSSAQLSQIVQTNSNGNHINHNNHQEIDGVQSIQAIQQLQQLKEEDFDESDLIRKAALERKLQNFTLLREWDLKRADTLNTHAQVLETIQGNVDQALIFSHNFLQMLAKFFSVKARQELNYARTPIPKPSAQLPRTEEASVYGEFIRAMNLLDEANIEHQKRVSVFADVIETQILQGRLLLQLEEGQKIFDKIRSDIIQLKRAIVQVNKEAALKSNKLAHLYNQHQKSLRSKNKFTDLPLNEKDFYKCQLGFLRKAKEQQESQRLLAKLTMNFWQSAFEHEKATVTAVQECLQVYVTSFQACYGTLPQNEEIIQLASARLQPQEMRKIFGVKSILKESLLKQLSIEIARPKLHWKDLNIHFAKFQVPVFDNRLLIIKQLIGARDTQQGVFRECLLSLTADRFLLIFDMPLDTDRLKKPSVTYKLYRPSVRKLARALIEITLPIDSGMLGKVWQQNQRFVLQFKSDDELEEFWQVIAAF